MHAKNRKPETIRDADARLPCILLTHPLFTAAQHIITPSGTVRCFGVQMRV